MISEFIPFPKIARYSRYVICTEKLDGSNASIRIEPSGEIYFGSRTRWLTKEADNFGFHRWGMEHKDELLTLGPGTHFGEWWGSGIQRTYGLKDKRLSLFNVSRWCLHGNTPKVLSCANPNEVKMQDMLPLCVGLVPVIWTGLFDDLDVTLLSMQLKEHGSYAVEGFMDPEGFVIFHTAGNLLFKKTLEKDESPKSLS